MALRKISRDEAIQIASDIVAKVEEERRKAAEDDAWRNRCLDCEDKDARIVELEEMLRRAMGLLVPLGTSSFSAFGVQWRHKLKTFLSDIGTVQETADGDE